MNLIREAKEKCLVMVANKPIIVLKLMFILAACRFRFPAVLKSFSYYYDFIIFHGLYSRRRDIQILAPSKPSDWMTCMSKDTNYISGERKAIPVSQRIRERIVKSKTLSRKR